MSKKENHETVTRLILYRLRTHELHRTCFYAWDGRIFSALIFVLCTNTAISFKSTHTSSEATFNLSILAAHELQTDYTRHDAFEILLISNRFIWDFDEPR